MSSVHSTSTPNTMEAAGRLGPLGSRPKVSVLITNYNYEEFLPRSIESALSQRWFPIEVIVSDDGSSDRSCQVVESYIDQGDPVTLVRGQHGGMAACLNSAFDIAKGEIICLLDADDYFYPGKVDAVVSAFQSNPNAGFCVHRTQRVDQDGRLGGAFPLLQSLPSGDCRLATVRNSGILMGLPPTSALSLRREVADLIFPLAECYVGYAEQIMHRIAPLVTDICRIDDALSSWTLHRRNDANSSQVKVERLEREINFMEMLWQDQHRYLQVNDPFLARQLEPLDKNALFIKTRYIVGRLRGNKEAKDDHRALCNTEEMRHSSVRAFWRYSHLLPRSIFRKGIDLLETQGWLKQVAGKLFKRQSSMA